GCVLTVASDLATLGRRSRAGPGPLRRPGPDAGGRHAPGRARRRPRHARSLVGRAGLWPHGRLAALEGAVARRAALSAGEAAANDPRLARVLPRGGPRP